MPSKRGMIKPLQESKSKEREKNREEETQNGCQSPGGRPALNGRPSRMIENKGEKVHGRNGLDEGRGPAEKSQSKTQKDWHRG